MNLALLCFLLQVFLVFLRQGRATPLGIAPGIGARSDVLEFASLRVGVSVHVQNVSIAFQGRAEGRE